MASGEFFYCTLSCGICVIDAPGSAAQLDKVNLFGLKNLLSKASHIHARPGSLKNLRSTRDFDLSLLRECVTGDFVTFLMLLDMYENSNYAGPVSWDVDEIRHVEEFGEFRISDGKCFALRRSLLGSTINGKVVRKGTLLPGSPWAPASMDFMYPAEASALPQTLEWLSNYGSERFMVEVLAALPGSGTLVCPEDVNLHLVEKQLPASQWMLQIHCKSLRGSHVSRIVGSMRDLRIHIPVLENVNVLCGSCSKGSDEPFLRLSPDFPLDILSTFEIRDDFLPIETSIMRTAGFIQECVNWRLEVLLPDGSSTKLPLLFKVYQAISLNRSVTFVRALHRAYSEFWRPFGRLFLVKQVQGLEEFVILPCRSKPLSIVILETEATGPRGKHLPFAIPFARSKEFIVVPAPDGFSLSEMHEDLGTTERLQLAESLVRAVDDAHAIGLSGLALHPSDVLYHIPTRRVTFSPLCTAGPSESLKDLEGLLRLLRFVLGTLLNFPPSTPNRGLEAELHVIDRIQTLNFGRITDKLGVLDDDVKAGPYVIQEALSEGVFRVCHEKQTMVSLLALKSEFRTENMSDVGFIEQFLTPKEYWRQWIVVQEPFPNSLMLTQLFEIGITAREFVMIGTQVISMLVSMARKSFKTLTALTSNDFVVDRSEKRVRFWNLVKVIPMDRDSTLSRDGIQKAAQRCSALLVSNEAAEQFDTIRAQHFILHVAPEFFNSQANNLRD